MVSSGYFEGVQTGKKKLVLSQLRRIRNEDVTALTFPDKRFDVLLSFDVLEHVPDYKQALLEFSRVLDDGGYLILTAPFSFQQETIVRAVVHESGEIEHLMAPCYHSDPLSKKGILAFYDFGMDLLDELKAVGFRESFLVCYDSNEWGYAGENIAYVARK